jgi:hypothetical protein
MFSAVSFNQTQSWASPQPAFITGSSYDFNNVGMFVSPYSNSLSAWTSSITQSDVLRLYNPSGYSQWRYNGEGSMLYANTDPGLLMTASATNNITVDQYAGTWTFQLWVKANIYSQSAAITENRTADTGGGLNWTIATFNDAGTTGFGWATQGANLNSTFQKCQTTSNNWVNIAFAVSKSFGVIGEVVSVQSYLNGAIQTTQPNQPIASSAATPGILKVCDNSPFSGSLGRLTIYNRVLTTEEILQNYNADYWRFYYAN